MHQDEKERKIIPRLNRGQRWNQVQESNLERAAGQNAAVSKVKICSVEGCGRKPVGRGLCMSHHARLMRYGDINPTKPIGAKGGRYNPNWRGGKAIHKNGGRVMIYSPDHPHGKYVFRYRLVMEQKLGRILEPTEIVHHINGDPTDDRPENLEVMSQSQHAKIRHDHHKKDGQWALHYAHCILCGASDKKHAGRGMCTTCHSKQFRQSRK